NNNKLLGVQGDYPPGGVQGQSPWLIQIINGLQSGFPLTSSPFAVVAAQLKMEEALLLRQLNELLQEGFLTRFGPFFNAERMGGGVTLAAMRVPECDFEAVAALLNEQPEVAHNYARDHEWNMWFVVATERQQEIRDVLARIESLTNLLVFDLPKLEEYRLGFQLRIDANGAIDTHPFYDEARVDTTEMPEALDRAIIAATQAGLPLVAEPYRAVAETLCVHEETVLAHLRKMVHYGWIRRIGVATNHYRLGLKGNGMSVWNVPDEKVSQLGKKIGALGFVTHCYQRPRHPPAWPYNLFVMVHGPDREAVGIKIDFIKELLGSDNKGHLVLHSTRILKKTGLRFKTMGGQD
ncbi:MAG: Lrp/AsnC family transcriptional regulator, partial [Magnetococcales bacterium]|nr:Lrp/AsnC family transcriptional regulator [Magnetococcales bacterium]